jgi:hypothetical protein
MKSRALRERERETKIEMVDGECDMCNYYNISTHKHTLKQRVPFRLVIHLCRLSRGVSMRVHGLMCGMLLTQFLLALFRSLVQQQQFNYTHNECERKFAEWNFQLVDKRFLLLSLLLRLIEIAVCFFFGIWIGFEN